MPKDDDLKDYWKDVTPKKDPPIPRFLLNAWGEIGCDPLPRYPLPAVDYPWLLDEMNDKHGSR
jgi:hypothetical protein